MAVDAVLLRALGAEVTIRCLKKDRDELVMTVLEATEDDVIVVAVLSKTSGALVTTDNISDKDLCFIGQVVTETAMRSAFDVEE